MKSRTLTLLKQALGLALIPCGISAVVNAQPICSIQLGNDTTICEGESVTLQGPAGFPSYSWSNGAGTQSTTVNSAGTYTCQVTYPTGNMAVNSTFSAGNTGFTTMFNYNSNLVTDGNYWIGTNAALYHPQFQGTGNGQFMIINAGWMHSGWRFWCQNVTVCPGQTYTIAWRAASLASQGPPTMAVFVNEVWTGTDYIAPAAQGVWGNYSTQWTAPGGVTSADVCIQISSGWGVGNDLGFDDVTINANVVLSDDIVVNVTPLPVFDLGPNATLCTGQVLNLDAAVPGATYLWQDGSALPTYAVSGPGNYDVTVTANSCTASDAITVNYNPTPAVDLGPDLTLCTGQTTLLDVTQPGATYSWQDGSTASTFLVNAAGVYAVNVALNGCFAGDAVNVAYNPLPVVNLGPDRTICAGTQTILDATTPGATYLWQDGSTSATFAATTAGPYTVQVTVNGCSATDAINVGVTPLPVVNLGPDLTICPGSSVVLNATVPGATYLWQDGSTAATFNASTAGVYSVQVTKNSCSASDAVTIGLHTLPVVDLGADQTICQGAPAVNFAVSVPGATYTWNTGASTNSIQTSTAGIYWLDVTQNGCVVRDSVEVIVNPLPTVALGADHSLCPGFTSTLDATNVGATYLWNTGATSATINAGPGAYSVDVTLNGCTTSDAITIGQFPTPAVDLGADTLLCPGQQLPLNVFQPGAGYLWQDGSNAASFTAQSTGTYSVQLTDANGCIANDAIDVTYASTTPIDLGPDFVLCSGDQVVLDATVPGASYLWNTGAVTPTLAVSTNGAFSVVVTQGTCTVTDAVNVATTPVPVVDLGPDLALCPGDAVVLNAGNPGSSYLWNTGALSATINVQAGGNYSVTVTNAAGCSTSDAVIVIYAAPGAIDLGPDLAICQGSSTTLDGTLPGATYAWNSGPSTATINVSVSGTYWVLATQGACVVSDTVVVNVLPVPVVDLGVDLTLCSGDDVLLDATSPGATYLWNTGSTAASITASTAGTYSVTIDLNGCTATDQIDIAVLNLAAVDLGPDLTLCAGQSAVLDATLPGVGHLWNTGATTQTINVSTPGTYWVRATQGVCSVSDTVLVNLLPVPVVDLGADLTLCSGDDVLLDATTPGATYLWNTGSTGASITASTAGTYSITVDLNGCTATDQIDIAVLDLAAVDLGPNLTLCAGQSALLDATLPGVGHLWSTGAITPTINVSTTGTYWVRATQGICSVSDTVVVNVLPVPVVDLGVDLTLCSGEDVLLDATTPGATYLWNTGSTTATVTASTAGTYSVTVDLNGCTATDQIDIAVLNLAAVDLGPDITLCAGQSALLDATLPGVSHLWSTGATSPTISVTTPGTYWVRATQGICSVSDTVVVNVLPVPVVNLGVDLTLCSGDDVLLDATSPGATYLWNTGSTAASITASTAGTYSVTVDLNGCTATDQIDIAVLNLTAVDLGPDLTLCTGESALLDAALPGGNFLWSTGANTPSITVSNTSQVWVEISQGACTASDTVNVVVLDPGSIDLGPDQTVCAGNPVVLDASLNGASYLWSNGATTPTLSVTTSGTYAVTAAVGQCIVTDDCIVVVNPVPQVDIGPDQSVCPGSIAAFDASTAGGTYLWHDGTTAPTYSTYDPGQVSVTVTASGCGVMDAAQVIVLAGPVAELGSDTTLCAGADMTLNVGQPGASYLWQDGSTSSFLTVDATGVYQVTVMLSGCTVSDAIAVSVFEPSGLDLGPDQILCPDQSTTLATDMGGVTHLWSTGASTPTISVDQGGVYWVDVRVAACIARDSIVIDEVVMNRPTLGADLVLCDDETVDLAVQPGAATVLWSTGDTGNTIHVTTEGTYTVSFSQQGCVLSDAIYVTVRERVDTVDLGSFDRVCPERPLTLDATVPGASYVWSTGSTAPSLLVTEPGTYSVQLTGPCIAAMASMDVVSGNCDPAVYVPNTFTPNGDGRNDLFYVSINGPVLDFELFIFDRWGERIFNSNDVSQTWDGTVNGTFVQDGVYVYRIRYRAIKDQGAIGNELVGHVNVLR